MVMSQCKNDMTGLTNYIYRPRMSNLPAGHLPPLSFPLYLNSSSKRVKERGKNVKNVGANADKCTITH